MKNEFTLAFNEVLEDKQLPKEVILQALEAAMVSAYRRAVNASNAQHVEASVDPETGKVTIRAEKEVVDVVQDERTEVSVQDAILVDPQAKNGDMVVVESTPKDFGRVAAQTARQVIQQRIREAERDTQLSHYSKQMGEIVSGIIQAITPQGVTLGLDMKAEGILPRNQQVPGERFRVHDRIQTLLLEVKESPRGPQIILSRAHRNFLRRLLENEVPEIYHGLVEIRSIAREPGQRSKVAVAALQPAVDPVGACVGIRGVRIQAIVHELNDEKIDVIEWNPDPAAYIAKALSPARVNGVYLNDSTRGAKTATVVVPEDQLSLAIGRDGQNARLAAKLTAWRIDIKSLPEAASDALNKLNSDPEYSFLLEPEADTVPQIEAVLAKKAEGRPVTPEEFQLLAQFVDRVERGIIRRRHVEKSEADERYKKVRATVPEKAFAMFLEDLPFSPRIYNLLSEAGYDTLGSLMLQLELDSDEILALGGIGPKALDEIKSVIASVKFPVEEEPAQEVIPVPELEEIPAEAIPVAVEPESVLEPAVSFDSEKVSLVEAEPGITEPQVVEPGVPAEIEPEPSSPVAEIVMDEEEKTLDSIFTLRPDVFTAPVSEEEDDDETGPKKGKKAKKKKRKFTEVEYDPDRDVLMVKKKKKHGGEWEDTWEF
jgi:transcription termination/antitermination protein NusA